MLVKCVICETSQGVLSGNPPQIQPIFFSADILPEHLLTVFFPSSFELCGGGEFPFVWKYNEMY